MFPYYYMQGIENLIKNKWTINAPFTKNRKYFVLHIGVSWIERLPVPNQFKSLFCAKYLCVKNSRGLIGLVGFMVLNATSTIFQLYRWRKPEHPEKTTDLSQVTDCIGSYKSNNHTITTTTAPTKGLIN
jgi:hypothetical protein